MPDVGTLQVSLVSNRGKRPITDAAVEISSAGEPDKILEVLKEYDLDLTVRAENLTIEQFIEISNKLNEEYNNLILVVENYPDLKASEQFLKLQKSLIKVESELQAARRIYNSDTTKYNTKLNVFPSNIIGKIFNFKEGDLFELEDRKIEGENIKVDM